MADKKKGGLGRGLDFLFSDSILTQPASVLDPVKSPINDEALQNQGISPTAKASAADDGLERVVYIGLNDIKPNSAQPRKNFDQEALQELADSINAHGVIQPVLLRPAAKGYELVAGERRWRAARLAGLKSVPAIIRDLDERQNAFYALIENMQREDLDPIEEADGIREIIGNYGLTQEEAAGVIGKSRSYVTNSLRVARLPEQIRALVSSGGLSQAPQIRCRKKAEGRGRKGRGAGSGRKARDQGAHKRHPRPRKDRDRLLLQRRAGKADRASRRIINIE